MLTPEDEVARRGIAAAWAGGLRGRTVINRLLPQVRLWRCHGYLRVCKRPAATAESMTCPQVSGLLSPSGKFFLVTVADNDPEDILRGLQAHSLAGGFDRCENSLAAQVSLLCTRKQGCRFAGQEVLRRSADEETLHVLQCWRQ